MRKRKVVDTSLSALKQAKSGVVKEHQEKILEALGKAEYLNYEEIAVNTNLAPAQVGRRISELIADGKAYRTAFKKPTKTGRMAYCLALIGKGIPVAQSSETEPKKRQKKTIGENKKTIVVRSYERSIKKEKVHPKQNLLI